MSIESLDPPSPVLAAGSHVSAPAPALGIAERNPALVYLARLAPGSRRTMRTALATIAALAGAEPADPITFPWALLRYPHTAAIRAALAERYAPATANKHLAALRGVLREAWRLELMTAEDYHRAADLPTLSAHTLPRGRHVGYGELDALVRVCRADPLPAGVRDGAMLGMAFSAGLRVSELVALTVADVNTDTGELRVRAGKGRKDRTGYLPHGAHAALRDWLALRGRDAGAVFCPIDKAGTISIRPMTTQAVYARFQLRARQAGLAVAFSPHDGRRTWIGNLLDAGVDLATVRHLAGHASVQTTARYDRRGEHAKRQAAGLLHFPWGSH